MITTLVSFFVAHVTNDCSQLGTTVLILLYYWYQDFLCSCRNESDRKRRLCRPRYSYGPLLLGCLNHIHKCIHKHMHPNPPLLLILLPLPPCHCRLYWDGRTWPRLGGRLVLDNAKRGFRPTYRVPNTVVPFA